MKRPFLRNLFRLVLVEEDRVEHRGTEWVIWSTGQQVLDSVHTDCILKGPLSLTPPQERVEGGVVSRTPVPDTTSRVGPRVGSSPRPYISGIYLENLLTHLLDPRPSSVSFLSHPVLEPSLLPPWTAVLDPLPLFPHTTLPVSLSIPSVHRHYPPEGGLSYSDANSLRRSTSQGRVRLL